MRSALLIGGDHPQLGAVAAVAEGRAAITLCRGGAPKTYSYVDPNEDAVLFAAAIGGTLVAVADGHDGSSGSQAAVEYLKREIAPAWTAVEASPATSESWHEIALDVLAGCNHAVLERAGQRGLPPAPTTLSLALVREQDDFLGYASVGDSHIFRSCANGTVDLGWASLNRRRAFFLGYEAGTAESQRDRSLIGCMPLAETSAIVLATDGLSELGIGVEDPAGVVATSVAEAMQVKPELRPLAACKSITDAAMRSHQEQAAGDNIACAVLWLGGVSPN